MRAPDFWRTSGLLPSLLSPISWVWAWRTQKRLHNITPYKVRVPVICIGNVVAGGAGKTPVAGSMERPEARCLGRFSEPRIWGHNKQTNTCRSDDPFCKSVTSPYYLPV